MRILELAGDVTKARTGSMVIVTTCHLGRVVGLYRLKGKSVPQEVLTTEPIVGASLVVTLELFVPDAVPPSPEVSWKFQRVARHASTSCISEVCQIVNETQYEVRQC